MCHTKGNYLFETHCIYEGHHIDASIYSAWRNHSLSYKDQTLKTITEDLERYYNVKFKFEKPELSHIRFSINVQRFNDVYKLLDLLKETGKIDYTIKRETIIIKENRPK